MKKALFLCIVITTAVINQAVSQNVKRDWQSDILGNGYEMRHVNQGYSFSGPVISTIVRKRSERSDTKRGVLYIHGFNDYFFQSEMGDRFVNHGYDFYAVDLRRYGRSLLPGQKPFDIRDMSSYFSDIDSALVEMKRAGLDEIILMGHSTGGLTAAYYESKKHPAAIKALILNSPFLDWNQGWKERVIPVVTLIGRILPDMKIPQGESTAYSESLLKNRHGEWTFNTQWKIPQSPDVTAGWIRAISLAQLALRDGKANIKVPILLMYSSRSVSGKEWSPQFQRGDAVLDVADIKKYGLGLGPHVTCLKVMNGLHDLVLSSPGIREPLYKYIFNWLDKQGL